MMQRGVQAERGNSPMPARFTGISFLSFGFRPFFLGAALWAVLSMILWIGALAGLWQLAPGYGALVWHAHEMLFGYTSAVVAGFLLTAVPSWTGRLPIAGWRLALLFSLWCLARIAFLATGATGPLPPIVMDSLFLPCLLLVTAREIVAGRNWRNLPPLILVGLLGAANIGFHAEVLAGAPDVSMRVAVAALIGLIMLIGGRITPSFTHTWLLRMGSPHLPASFGPLDKVTLIASGVALVLWIVTPTIPATGLLFLAAAAAQAARLWRWSGIHAWGEPLVLILHLGYAFVPLGFLLGAISILVPGTLAGTAALHAWTVGAIGLMTLGVMTRATRGHTGRDLTASAWTMSIYGAMTGAALLRMAAGIFPQGYLVMLEAAGTAWVAAFAMFLFEYAPMLLGPRSERSPTA